MACVPPHTLWKHNTCTDPKNFDDNDGGDDDDNENFFEVHFTVQKDQWYIIMEKPSYPVLSTSTWVLSDSIREFMFIVLSSFKALQCEILTRCFTL